MTMHVNVAAVWKEITGAHVNVSSVWKEISEGWVNVAGVWKKFYANFGLAASLGFGTYVSEDAGSLGASCTVTVKNDGSWMVTGGGNDVLSGTPTSGSWGDPTPTAGGGDGFEVKYSHTGVTGTGSITNGAIGYTTISGDITFVFSAGSTQNGLTNLTVDIRKIGTTSPVLTQTFQIGATGGSA